MNISFMHQWQPSHQTDTGKDFSEAATCNGIAEAAMQTKPQVEWGIKKPVVLIHLHHHLPHYLPDQNK